MKEIFWGIVDRKTSLMDRKNGVNPISYFKKEALRLKRVGFLTGIGRGLIKDIILSADLVIE